jgi:type IV pilus assembly protein PilF
MNQKYISRILGVVFASLVLAGCASHSPSDDVVTESATERLINTDVAMASIYLNEGKLKFAKEKADKAIALDSRNSQANHINGLLYWRLGELDKADRYFRRAIRYQSDNAEALNNYGAFLCDQKHYDQSIEYFDRAAANPLYKDRAKALANAGRCLALKGDKLRAETYLRKALKIDANYPSALFELSKLAFHSGRTLTAREFLHRLFATGVTSSDSLYLAYRVEIAMGNRAGARKYARWLRSKYPKSREAARVAIQ